MKRRLVTENQLLSKLSSSSRCWKSTQMWKRKLWSLGFSACKSCSRYPFTRRRLRRMRQTLDWGICNSRLAWCVEFSWQTFLALSTVSADGPAGLFFSHAQAATLLEFHVPLTNCLVHTWSCAVHGPKPPLHRHNWLSFGKFQDTERFLIPCPFHVSSRLPPSGETCKYATVPSTKKKLEEILYLLICSFLLCLSWLLRSRVRKSWRNLWITLYVTTNHHIFCLFFDFFKWRFITAPASYVHWTDMKIWMFREHC